MYEDGFTYVAFYSEDTHMYGVRCFNGNGNILREIDDITEERAVIEDFCLMLNLEEIYPCHFYDVYEDLFG